MRGNDFLVPDLDYESILGSKEWKKNAYKYLFFLGTLVDKMVKFRSETNDYYSLRAKDLRTVINTRQYKIVRDNLLKHFIDCDDIYIKGEKSFGYRLKDSNWKLKFIKLPKHIVSKLDSIEKPGRNTYMEQQLEKIKIDPSIYTDLDTIIYNIPYDVTFFYYQNVLHSHNKNIILRYLLNRFEDNPKIAFRDNTSGRLHSPFTVLPRVLRGYLHLKNEERIVQIDISNAQPLFLIELMRRNNIEIINDAERFYEICSKGELYDHLMDEFKWPKSRDEFKLWFFISIMYGKNRNDLNFKKFKNLYPTVAKFIWNYKSANHRTLSIDLQKIETEIVIDGVAEKAKSIYGLDIFLATIHDAIFTGESTHSIISQLLDEEMEKLDLVYDKKFEVISGNTPLSTPGGNCKLETGGQLSRDRLNKMILYGKRKSEVGQESIQKRWMESQIDF